LTDDDIFPAWKSGRAPAVFRNAATRICGRKKLYFWRKRGPLFDVIWSEMSRIASIASPEAYLAYMGSRGFHPERKFREQIKYGLEAGFARELELW